MNEIKTTLGEFLTESKGYILIDFYTSWCQPCKLLTPVLASLESEFPNISFLKIDVKLVPLNYIKSVPTLIIYKDDLEIERRVGLMSRPYLKKWLETLK